MGLATDDTASQRSIAKELVSLLSRPISFSAGAQQHAMRLVLDMASDPAKRGAMASAGAISQLVRQLRDAPEAGQQLAAGALSQIKAGGIKLKKASDKPARGPLGAASAATDDLVSELKARPIKLRAAGGPLTWFGSTARLASASSRGTSCTRSSSPSIGFGSLEVRD